MEFVPRVSDDTLERYAMQSLPGSESEQLEDHLLICPECQEHLRATDAYLAAMRGACLQDRGRETGLS